MAFGQRNAPDSGGRWAAFKCFVRWRTWRTASFKASSFDVALLSNVYHHIFDRPSCAEELSRVLRAGGYVLIRGVFADRLGEITLFDYFPEAKVVCEQFPTLPEVLVEAGHEQ